MNYRIDYAPMRLPAAPRGRAGRLLALTAGAFLLFLTAVFLFWPAGRQTLLRAAFPGQEAQQFLSALASGTPPGEAAAAFCRSLIAGSS